MMVYHFPCQTARNGPDYVLVHGIGVSARSYATTAVALAREGDVYLVDLPGFGRSPRPDVDMTIERHALVLRDFLAERNLDRPVVVGHSMGAQVVAELAANHPEVVDHIVLIAPVVAPEARNLSAVSALLLRNGLKEPPIVTMLATYDYFRAGMGYMVEQTKHLLDNRLEETARRVKAKTLVICGESDPIVPLEWGRQLAQAFEQGWFASVPGPHAMIFSSPRIITRHLNAHAKR